MNQLKIITCNLKLRDYSYRFFENFEIIYVHNFFIVNLLQIYRNGEEKSCLLSIS